MKSNFTRVFLKDGEKGAVVGHINNESPVKEGVLFVYDDSELIWIKNVVPISNVLFTETLSKGEYQLVLKEYFNKLKVVKTIHSILEKEGVPANIKIVTNMVESSPVVILESVTREKAFKYKQEFLEIEGTKVELIENL